MIKLLKLMMIILMVLGIMFSIINFISVDNMASAPKKDGTQQPDGCYGAEFNC